jgi:hypothetical protein
VPTNPLDAIAAPEVIEADYQTTEPEVDSDTVETVAEVVEVVEVVATEEATEEATDPVPEGNWTLYIPRKDPQQLASLEDWLKEYNALADKTAGAGKAAPRKRMTALRELREANEPTIKRTPTLVKVVLTQGHQTRLAWLGHQMREEEGKSDNVKEDHGLQRQT